jgi:hypothetical protein
MDIARTRAGGAWTGGAWIGTVAAAPAIARNRLRRTIRSAGWGGGPRPGWLSSAAPALAAVGTPPGDWSTEWVTVTDTAVAVAVVRCRDGGDRRVVKMPYTAEGADSLRRQSAVLATLHRDPRLAGWPAVLPRQLAEGTAGGHRYWVESAVPGTAPTDDAFLGPAAQLIGVLHARTRADRTVDAALIERWVQRPLDRLRSFLAADPPRSARLVELGAELTAALAGRTVRTGWIHGDFWPGNVLTHGPAVTGIVDWDRAEPDQLPLHDLLHLRLSARRARDGDQLGEIVARALRQGLDDASGVGPGCLDAWLGGVPPRAAVLLYWLRHISLFVESEGHGDNRDWVRRNVHSVLNR